MEETSANAPLDDLPSWINASLIEDALRRNDANENIHVESFTVSRATAPGDNYGSIMYRVKATLSPGGGERTLVVKALPNSEAVSNALSESKIFRTEIAMLTKYIPAMKAALDGVAPNRFPPFAAQCPLHDSASEQYLVLEDLKAQGFRLAERHRGLGLRHSLLALRSLARFHAASAKILKEDPSIMKALPNSYKENSSNFWEPFITTAIQVAADGLRKWNGFQDYADIIERFKLKVMDLLSELNDPNPGGFNVITHGDFWTNNMMFKYGENGSPIDIRLVDFQISHVTSPAIDVIQLLNTSVNEKVMKENEQLLLREYHAALTEALVLLDIKGPSFNEFLDDVNKYSACTLFIVVAYWPMTRTKKVIDVESTLKGETKSVSNNSAYESEETKCWLQYILPEYKRRGWLEY